MHLLVFRPKSADTTGSSRSTSRKNRNLRYTCGYARHKVGTTCQNQSSTPKLHRNLLFGSFWGCSPVEPILSGTSFLTGHGAGRGWDRGWKVYCGASLKLRRSAEFHRFLVGEIWNTLNMGAKKAVINLDSGWFWMVVGEHPDWSSEPPGPWSLPRLLMLSHSFNTVSRLLPPCWRAGCPTLDSYIRLMSRRIGKCNIQAWGTTSWRPDKSVIFDDLLFHPWPWFKRTRWPEFSATDDIWWYSRKSDWIDDDWRNTKNKLRVHQDIPGCPGSENTRGLGESRRCVFAGPKHWRWRWPWVVAFWIMTRKNVRWLVEVVPYPQLSSMNFASW